MIISLIKFHIETLKALEILVFFLKACNAVRLGGSLGGFQPPIFAFLKFELKQRRQARCPPDSRRDGRRYFKT
jgi:hypothetical protein